MNIILTAVVLFVISFLAHVIVWRIKKPNNHTVALLGIYILFLIVFVVFLKLTTFRIMNDYLDLAKFVSIYIMFLMAYVNSYSAIEAESPTFLIILLINQSGKKGMTKGEILGSLNNENLIIPRINDLLLSRAIIKKDTKLFINSPGILLVKLFIGFRKLLNLPKGG